jgi:hypothetical protein
MVPERQCVHLLDNSDCADDHNYKHVVIGHHAKRRLRITPGIDGRACPGGLSLKSRSDPGLEQLSKAKQGRVFPIFDLGQFCFGQVCRDSDQARGTGRHLLLIFE